MYWSKNKAHPLDSLDQITCDMPYLLFLTRSSELRRASGDLKGQFTQNRNVSQLQVATMSMEAQLEFLASVDVHCVQFFSSVQQSSYMD